MRVSGLVGSWPREPGNLHQSVAARTMTAASTNNKPVPAADDVATVSATTTSLATIGSFRLPALAAGALSINATINPEKVRVIASPIQQCNVKIVTFGKIPRNRY